ncbi:MAG: SDR family oxidoreductase [Nocardioides sp.]|uniref:SDR family oxidoreductase n=1 Tax=Nocardioides sp. TaxID=35761 RepID=UPI0039E42E8D
MNDHPPTAVVTGAGSGVGRATALALLGAGYRVALVGRREEILRETAKRSGRESDALVATADITDEESVRTLFDTVVERWSRVDVLFNNAGIFGAGGPFAEITLEDWQAVVDTNLTGSFLCAREAFRRMKEQTPQGGRIINNGSVSAQVPRPEAAPYTATKHGMTGLTKSISLEGRPFDIACGQIDIGNAATELTGSVLGHGALQADGSVTVEPMMNVRAVADAVVQMASLPLTANVQFMTIMATKMPLIGRG